MANDKEKVRGATCPYLPLLANSMLLIALPDNLKDLSTLTVLQSIINTCAITQILEISTIDDEDRPLHLPFL